MWPRRSPSEDFGMTCTLSRFTTDALESPSRFPTGTSCGIPRIVDVTSATMILLRYAYAAVRVSSNTGRRPTGGERLAQRMSYCFTGVLERGVALAPFPTRQH